LIGALHVESLRHDALHAEREPHTIFQASTIEALLHGRYDGDDEPDREAIRRLRRPQSYDGGRRND
jgi:hypothetical protein